MTDYTWKYILGQLAQSIDLQSIEASWAMNTMMSGTSTDAQIAAFVMGLKVKGETATEVGGLVEAMLSNAVAVPLDYAAVDVVGTGGDGAQTVNISTMSALVVAGTGAPVLKHGNRAISSKSGTADVLEALGVAVNMPAERVSTCLADAGIAFCFAPNHHPAMRYAATTRKELGIPTVFNVLGPLANPGQPAAALLGCADSRFAPVLAQVQLSRNLKSMVVRSDEGLDELSTSSTSQVWDVTAGVLRHEVLDPTDMGLQASTTADLRGGEAQENAQVVRDLLQGSREGRLSVVRDVVALNSAAALVAFDAASGSERFGSVQQTVRDRVANALPVAYQSIDSGAAWDVLVKWASVSTALSQ
jgi:anthranilate phosphoribosyltransferase